LASEKIGKDLWHQVYYVTDSEAAHLRRAIQRE
jgi:hypothetical protein